MARALEASAGAPQPAAELVWALVDSFPETFDEPWGAECPYIGRFSCALTVLNREQSRGD